MPTKRTPIARQHNAPVTETAIKLFIQMQRLRCTCDPEKRFDECPGCERWKALEEHLGRELGCRPWEYPAIQDPRAGNPEPPGTYNYERWQPDLKARERWKALARGTRELRRQERQARRAMPLPF
jgi:hypothetical protein